MMCPIIQLALSILMKHLVIGQHQKAPNFSVFHWSPHGRMVYIGQHFVTTRVVHLPKRTETSLITESDRSRITESDQAVRAVHSCNSWFELVLGHTVWIFKTLQEKFLSQEDTPLNLYVSDFRSKLLQAFEAAKLNLKSTQDKMKRRYDKNTKQLTLIYISNLA